MSPRRCPGSEGLGSEGRAQDLIRLGEVVGPPVADMVPIAVGLAQSLTVLVYERKDGSVVFAHLERGTLDDHCSRVASVEHKDRILGVTLPELARQAAPRVVHPEP